MNVVESIIYGFISGMTEFLPVSSQGHQALMRTIFGANSPAPMRDIFIHIALLISLFAFNRTYFSKLKTEINLNAYSASKRKAKSDRRISQDLRLIRTAAIPMLVLLFLGILTAKLKSNLGFVTIFFILNGAILYLPEHINRANKDSGQMSALDAFLIGVFGVLSVLPGISRTGASLSYAIVRGAEGRKAFHWVLALSVPALLILIICDIVGIFRTGFGDVSFIEFLGYLIASVCAVVGAWIGMRLMKIFIDRSGCAVFGFYSWGAALLSLMLYLFV